jgi:hypothetical protein
MADQNQTTGGSQDQPANGTPSQPPSKPQEGQATPQGLMRLAGVQPSGTSYKSYEPADIELFIEQIKARDRG